MRNGSRQATWGATLTATRTKRRRIPERTDVVVIGAGMSGLIAAALLARTGLDVFVVEAEKRAGGYLAGFRRKGFVFDTAIHWLNQCGPGGIVHRILSHLGEDFPRCKQLTRIRRYKGDSFDVLLTSRPDDLKQDWIERFPAEREGIERFFRDAYRVGERMTCFSHLAQASETLGFAGKVAYLVKMTHWGLPFFNKFTRAAQKGLGSYFQSEELRRTFSTENNMMSVLVPIGWAYHGDFQAPPVGGSMQFPRWLTEQIQSAGSRLILGRRVQRVIADGCEAGGVVLAATGRRPEQTVRSRYVISTGDLVSLYEHMLPADLVDQRFLSRLRRMELYSSSVTIHLGLDCKVEEFGFDEEMWTLTRDSVPLEEQNSGDPERSSIQILAPSFRDPTLAPPGKGTLTVYVAAEMEQFDRWKTGPGFERGEAYRAFKDEYARKILRRIEDALEIDLQSHVEVMEVATPVTHWRYTGNRDGSIMGGRPSGYNIRHRMAHYRTRVKRLYVSGHWAEYGGGVPVATRAAANAALLILQETNPEEYRRLCDVMNAREIARARAATV